MTRITVTPAVRRALLALWLAGVRTGQQYETAVAALGDLGDVPPEPARRAVRLRLDETGEAE